MRARTSDGSRSAGVVPLLAGVVSAIALTGAAVYTVTEARCEPGHYVTDGRQVTLIGSCVSGAELREAGHERPGPEDASPSNFRP
ncbi:hypothetical protein SAXI111661_15195 [Saccharomonospora xinjiangensis]|uniref:Uncharacterized protein n=1 Tax=Saccharomonospora xinjiangensis XJ-54 TaxID=882086 RepID=I0V4W9_9PSEU|nr:hypothetical protein [Saccharomonospora xinjiangensis]EID55172.1 hypothetical protein SacxiDRAFT_2960 [Saccharomonospora xinjiangensis XJ-54]QBQ61875.1 hypothetical protein EYD13_17655 [Saccharomonospora xinjiangensis]